MGMVMVMMMIVFGRYLWRRLLFQLLLLNFTQKMTLIVNQFTNMHLEKEYFAYLQLLH